MSGPSQATSLSFPGSRAHDLLLRVGSAGSHSGPGSYPNWECLPSFLARAQLALKCPRTSVLIFQVCCPDSAIALSTSVDWFLTWSGLFLICSLVPTKLHYSCVPDFCLLPSFACWSILTFPSYGSTLPYALGSVPRPCPFSDYMLSLLLSTLPQISQPWLLLSYVYFQSQEFSAGEKDIVKGAERIQEGKGVKASKIHFASASFTNHGHFVRLQWSFKKLINPQ